MGFGFRVSGFGLRASGLGLRGQVSGFRVEDSGFRVQCLGVRQGPGAGPRWSSARRSAPMWCPAAGP